jgi:hypothetical protein
MNARLPENLETYTIDSMARGERAWTVPWAMWVDTNRRCWLNPNYSVHSKPDGTAQMAVRRLEDGTYEVDVTGLDYRWDPASEPSYVDHNGGWLPVATLIGGA